MLQRETIEQTMTSHQLKQYRYFRPKAKKYSKREKIKTNDTGRQNA